MIDKSRTDLTKLDVLCLKIKKDKKINGPTHVSPYLKKEAVALMGEFKSTFVAKRLKLHPYTLKKWKAQIEGEVTPGVKQIKIPIEKNSSLTLGFVELPPFAIQKEESKGVEIKVYMETKPCVEIFIEKDTFFNWEQFFMGVTKLHQTREVL
jgi:hypothetical protein